MEETQNLVCRLKEIKPNQPVVSMSAAPENTLLFNRACQVEDGHLQLPCYPDELVDKIDSYFCEPAPSK